MNDVADFVAAIRRRQVQLWLDEGQLRYRAPKGVLTPEDMECLRSARQQIVTLLQADAQPSAPGCPRLTFDSGVPLAFSQLAHWNLYELSERRAIRQVASATRLRGRLDVPILRESLKKVVRRHSALRSGIVLSDGVPTQRLRQADDYEFVLDDLSGAPENLRQDRILPLIDGYILKPIDPVDDPLFGVRLLKLGDDDHVLVAAMEHMISDAMSMSILLRDLFAIYASEVSGGELRLPAISLQFPEYAASQRQQHLARAARYGDYWEQRLLRFAAPRLPHEPAQGFATGWHDVPIRIEHDLKCRLREWSRKMHTTVALSIFSAYVALIMRWCDSAEVVVQYITDGRVTPQVQSTVGFFAFPLYLRVAVPCSAGLVDLVSQVTQEYCRAHERADFGYLASKVPRPDCARTPSFNWVPHGRTVDSPERVGSDQAIAQSGLRFPHPMMKTLKRDADPAIVLFDGDDEVVGDLYFPLSRFSSATMETFARNLLMCINTLLDRPQASIQSLVLLQ